ncbi:hypothetical protein KDA14_03680, partial [Candidatus Saccharibacteria bacterium]|nr:hypothetical protein [Candidatus Saccharibacteria bacterium]
MTQKIARKDYDYVTLHISKYPDFVRALVNRIKRLKTTTHVMDYRSVDATVQKITSTMIRARRFHVPPGSGGFGRDLNGHEIRPEPIPFGSLHKEGEELCPEGEEFDINNPPNTLLYDNRYFFMTPPIIIEGRTVRVNTHWLLSYTGGDNMNMVRESLDIMCSKKHQPQVTCLWTPCDRFMGTYDKVTFGTNALYHAKPLVIPNVAYLTESEIERLFSGNEESVAWRKIQSFRLEMPLEQWAAELHMRACKRCEQPVTERDMMQASYCLQSFTLSEDPDSAHRGTVWRDSDFETFNNNTDLQLGDGANFLVPVEILEDVVGYDDSDGGVVASGSTTTTTTGTADNDEDGKILMRAATSKTVGYKMIPHWEYLWNASGRAGSLNSMYSYYQRAGMVVPRVMENRSDLWDAYGGHPSSDYPRDQRIKFVDVNDHKRNVRQGTVTNTSKIVSLSKHIGISDDHVSKTNSLLETLAGTKASVKESIQSGNVRNEDSTIRTILDDTDDDDTESIYMKVDRTIDSLKQTKEDLMRMESNSRTGSATTTVVATTASSAKDSDGFVCPSSDTTRAVGDIRTQLSMQIAKRQRMLSLVPRRKKYAAPMESINRYERYMKENTRMSAPGTDGKTSSARSAKFSGVFGSMTKVSSSSSSTASMSPKRNKLVSDGGTQSAPNADGTSKKTRSSTEEKVQKRNQERLRSARSARMLSAAKRSMRLADG